MLGNVLMSRGKQYAAPNLLVVIFVFFCEIALMGLAVVGGSADVPMTVVFPALLIALILAFPIADWLSSRVDLLDPIALLSIFGVHYFLYGPFYQISHNFWPYLRWSSSIGAWVPLWYWLQLIFISMALFIGGAGRFQLRANRVANGASAERTMFIILLICGVAKAATFALFGGIGGMIEAYNLRIQMGVLSYNPFAGLGPLVFAGDAFPFVGAIAALWFVRKKSFAKSNLFFVSFMAVAFVFVLFLAGLRGSRSNTVYAMAIIFGTYHFMIRRIGRGTLLAGVVGLVLFMQGYYAFKVGGVESVFNPAVREEAFKTKQLQDTKNFVIIRDFTRMDVQVITLWRLMETGYEPVWGRSFVGGIASIIPQAILPNRPTNFIKEKTEIITPGRTFVMQGGTTLVFGEFGELLANFGILSVLFGVPFGFLLRYFRSVIDTVNADSPLVFVAPVLGIIPITFLVYDSNSWLYFFIQFLLAPALISWAAGRAAAPARRGASKDQPIERQAFSG